MIDTSYLERFELRQSDDDLKTDLELTCIVCDEHICDAEHGDLLVTLANMAIDHNCPGPTKED